MVSSEVGVASLHPLFLPEIHTAGLGGKDHSGGWPTRGAISSDPL